MVHVVKFNAALKFCMYVQVLYCSTINWAGEVLQYLRCLSSSNSILVVKQI